MTTSKKTPAAIAKETFAAIESAQQITPFSQRGEGFDLATAYAATAELRKLRQGRGETFAGRKIGFTNRAMWAEYGVYAPIWGDMYATTVHEIAKLGGSLSLAKMPEPKIEPEIAFKFSRAPDAGMDDAALMGCIEWIAHGFEIVQSIYPGWKFSAADGIAAGCLHGALVYGKPHRVEDMAAAFAKVLPKFSVTLLRDGEVIDRGVGANVLDGPVNAVRHLLTLLKDDTSNPPVGPGEIITTGSLTRAFPVAPGETWSTQIEGLPLSGVSVTFA
ncbi:MAG: 2-keto-4-pentenoate hydratase [Variibacter sp.]